jgi:hypothetical protein
MEGNRMTCTWATGPNAAGPEFYDLSHPWGHGVPAWPYFIEPVS